MPVAGGDEAAAPAGAILFNQKEIERLARPALGLEAHRDRRRRSLAARRHLVADIKRRRIEVGRILAEVGHADGEGADVVRFARCNREEGIAVVLVRTHEGQHPGVV